MIRRTFLQTVAAAGAAFVAGAGAARAEPARGDARAEALGWLSRFHRNAYHPDTGLTTDGLSMVTGKRRVWSAASKEALHIALLAKAVGGGAEERGFIDPQDPESADGRAIELLRRKLASLLEFADHPAYAGFGGFLPWFHVQPADEHGPERLRPATGWSVTVPALDNGQLMWAMFFAARRLRAESRRRGDAELGKLADGYERYFRRLARNAVTIFYDGNGKVRTEASVIDSTKAPIPENYRDGAPKYDLNDPYEGELMVLMMTLYGDWSSHPEGRRLAEDRSGTEPAWPNEAVRRVWRRKKATFKVRAHDTPQGKIRVKEGDVFSAHEAWGLLFAPYRSVPAARYAFEQDERYRTIRAAQNRGGLLGSANVVHGEGLRFRSLGIRENARVVEEGMEDWSLLTPYAAFPLIFLKPELGLRWLSRMAIREAQSPVGLLDSVKIDGKEPAPVATWDTNGLLQLALTDGIDGETRARLEEDGTWAAFSALVGWEYGEAFSEHAAPGPRPDFQEPPAAPALPAPQRDAPPAEKKIGDDPTAAGAPGAMAAAFVTRVAMNRGVRDSMAPSARPAGETGGDAAIYAAVGPDDLLFVPRVGSIAAERASVEAICAAARSLPADRTLHLMGPSDRVEALAAALRARLPHRVAAIAEPAAWAGDTLDLDVVVPRFAAAVPGGFDRTSIALGQEAYRLSPETVALFKAPPRVVFLEQIGRILSAARLDLSQLLDIKTLVLTSKQA